MSATESPDAKRLGERFDPFHDSYLADPYPFFAGGPGSNHRLL